MGSGRTVRRLGRRQRRPDAKPGPAPDPVQHAITLLAGPCAEARWLGVDWLQITEDGGADDLRQAQAALVRVADPPSLFDIASRANAVLSNHWKLVERLAFALVERKHLTFAQCKHITTKW